MERERRATAELGDALTQAERRVERRLAEWTSDFDRIQQGFNARLAELAKRQRDVVAAAQARSTAGQATPGLERRQRARLRVGLPTFF